MEEEGAGGAGVRVGGRRKWGIFRTGVTSLERGSCPVGGLTQPDQAGQQSRGLGRVDGGLPAGGTMQSPEGSFLLQSDLFFFTKKPPVIL